MPNLPIDNIDIHYEVNGTGQPLLFIHGLGSGARDWEEQIPFFARQYKVVTFDLRGHGQSAKPPGPYTMSVFACDTAEMIKSLALGPVHVVGISLGGMVAFQLAVDYPELIKSLIIVNSGPELVVRTLRDRWQIFLRFATVRLLGMRKMGDVLSKRLFPKEEHTDLRRKFVERWAENNPRAYLDTMRAIVNWSVAGRLHTITAPTLIIAADEDYTPVAAKEAYMPQLSQAELAVIPDSRHATPVECPQRFNETLMAFLSKQETI